MALPLGLWLTVTPVSTNTAMSSSLSDPACMRVQRGVNIPLSASRRVAVRPNAASWARTEASVEVNRGSPCGWR